MTINNYTNCSLSVRDQKYQLLTGEEKKVQQNTAKELNLTLGLYTGVWTGAALQHHAAALPRADQGGSESSSDFLNLAACI